MRRLNVKRFSSATASAVLALSSLMSMGFTGIAHAATSGNYYEWTGAASSTAGLDGCASNCLSVPGNWDVSTDSGNTYTTATTAPADNDILVFKQISASASTDYTLHNDMSADLTVGGIIVDLDQTVAKVTDTFNIYGSSIKVAAGGTVTTTGTLDTDTYKSGAEISLTSYNFLGSLTLTSGIGYALDSDSSGLGTINGNLTIAKDANLSGYAYNGTVIGSATLNGYTSLSAEAQFGSLIVNKDATANFTDFTTAKPSIKYPITLNGGEVSFNRSQIYDGKDWNYEPTTYTISGNLTLGADSQIDTGTDTTAKFTGKINLSGHHLTNDISFKGSVYLGSKLLINPAKTTALNGTKTTCGMGDSSGCYNVGQSETATLDGARDSIDVYKGGTLKGNGTTNFLYVGTGGTVAPGHSPGKLTVVNTLTLAGGSTYQAELKDVKVGDYDQLVVNGKNPGYTVTNYVTIGDSNGSPVLDVQLYKGANIKPGGKFTIIDNQSKTAVKGTFKNLPEGATFKVGNGTMKISYKGDDGNDVVLTAMTALSAPDTGFALASANPAATLGVAVLAAGTILGIARRTRKLAPARAKTNKRR